MSSVANLIALHNARFPRAQGTGSALAPLLADMEKKRNMELQLELERRQADQQLPLEAAKQGINPYTAPPSADGQGTPISRGTLIQRIAEKNKPFIPGDDFVADKISTDGKVSYKRRGSDMSELSEDDQVKAYALARRVAGVRGAQNVLPAIVSNMMNGKTVDQIEDDLRYSGQSAEMTGPIRSAAQSVMMTSNGTVSERAFDFIDDDLAKGDVEGAKEKLKHLARRSVGVDLTKNVMGKERTIEFLQEIQDELDILEANGIDTNIYEGKMEDIYKKVGAVRNPELRKVATKIQTAIQNYRKSMSGVAFSEPEAREYRDMFPSIDRVGSFNRANIEALRETMQGDLDSFYSLTMGPQNYAALYRKEEVPDPTGDKNFSSLWE